MRWLLLFAAVAAIVGGVWWYLRRPPQFPDGDAVFAEVIRRVDTDHDGRISRTEWKTYGGTDLVFDAYDFNGDGYLDVREFRALFLGTDPKPR